MDARNRQAARPRPASAGARERGGGYQRGTREQNERAGGSTGRSREVIRSCRDLRVYQGAIEAAARVFEITRSFPAEESQAMTAQMRRSSRAVCMLLGAAWRRRRSQSHFAETLMGCESEAEETRVWIELAATCGYLDERVQRELEERYDRICAQVARMIMEADRWTARGDAAAP